MKRFIATLFTALCLSSATLAAPAPPEIVAPSAILMDAAGGHILYEKNAHEKLHPASVTKIMSLLLIMEAMDEGLITTETMVTASEHAASMGGSQIFLEPGEKMTLDDLLKAVAVSSANDACVAIGEHIAGSEEGFVERMNQRASELGMVDTHFANCTGLDANGHMTTAYDIALMSRELLKHDKIRDYTTIWMDTVRNGEFGLSNTNKLVRFYDGTTGLKTGFTSSAGYCVSATARREGMELISVIMKAETSPKRNADASALLNFGFANYALVTPEEFTAPAPIPVKLGVCETVETKIAGNGTFVAEKGSVKRMERTITLSETLTAPVEEGQIVGSYVVTLDGEEQVRIPIVAAASVEKKAFGMIFRDLTSSLCGRK
ncbi:MAG: D-alanyl-D-alanine carboxypeptidase family protein [Clostridiaceae bacterium]|nr:D-alanyl-D-alanine carboxypeptidase family protein [Clostridiaceae bacterium]